MDAGGSFGSISTEREREDVSLSSLLLVECCVNMLSTDEYKGRKRELVVIVFQPLSFEGQLRSSFSFASE